MTEPYSDLLIRIRPLDTARGTYPVEAEFGDGSSFVGGELRLEPDRLSETLLDPEARGLALFDALFAGSMRRAYERAFAQPSDRVRCRLQIDDAASELHGLAWEGMYHLRAGQPVPLFVSTLTSLARYVSASTPAPQPVPPPEKGRPIRIVLAVSNPADLERFGLSSLDVEGEFSRQVEVFRRSINKLQQNGLLTVRVLVGRTGLSPTMAQTLSEEGYEVVDGPITLESLVTQMSDCHALHLMCHGAVSRVGDAQVALFLEDEGGRTQIVTDDRLVHILQALPQLPRLLFLMSGDSPRSHRVSPFVKLGRGLVRCGIPAAIVMQDVITFEGASLATSIFYDSLLRHGYVDQAMSEARLYLFNYRGGSGRDWLAPVLLTRLAIGQLISFEEKPKTPLIVLPPSGDPAQAMAKGFVAPLGGAGTVIPDLSRRIRMLTDSLRQLHILVDLANQLRQMQEAFHPCVMIVEQAGTDLLKIQVAPLTWVWQPLRSGSLKRLQLFLKQHADLPADQWLPPLLEQAEIIDNSLNEVNLGPLARGVTTFNRQLTEAEPAVRQQLDQAIAELVSFADQTLGRLDNG